MNIYIFVDMEGISGVSGSEFVTATGKLYQAARRYYTQDLNVCAQACFDAGASTVIARDGHGGGNHMLWEELDPRIELVQGSTGVMRMAGLEECEALILLGYHAMAGTSGALLEHTYSSKGLQNMWLNGRPVGEIGIDAAIAGDYGVPTIMVSGDNHACAEAEEWIPGVVPCVVKTGLGCQAARLLSQEKAHERIRQQTAAAIGRRDTIQPLVVDKPATVRREMVERLPVPSARPGVTIVDGRTYEVSADTVEKAFFAIA